MTNVPNPLKPLTTFEVNFTAGPPTVGGSARVSINNPANKCFVRQWDSNKGRQYELDQVQAGMCQLTMTDELENLNPLNTASPYNTGANTLTAYRAIGVAAYWPITGNVFCNTVNPVYDPSFESGISGGAFGISGGTLVQSSAQAFDGTHSLLVAQGSNTSGFWAQVVVPGVPGITATVSVYAYLTGGCSLQVQCPDGTNSTVLSTQTAWTRIVVTYTQVDARDTIVFAGTGTATPTYYLDAFQLEWATTASAFTTSGPTRYQIYNGYIERYPTTYDMAGIRANHQLQAVDAIANLSRISVVQSYDATITASNPLMYLKYNNSGPPAQGTLGGINTNNRIPYELPNSSNGAIQWSGDSTLDGFPAVVLNQKNPTNPVSSTGTIPNNETSLDIIGPPLSLSTIATTVECWAKFTSGVFGFMNLSGSYTETTLTPNGVYLDMETSAGKLWFHAHDPVAPADSFFASDTVNPAHNPFPDAQWHYYVINFFNDGAAGGLYYQVDDVGLTVNTIWNHPPNNAHNVGYGTVHAGAFTGFGDPISQGSIARLAVYARDLPIAELKSHYYRGVGYINELSGVRVRRLLALYWSGATNTANGYLKMAPDFDYNGRTLLEIIQEIQESERGLLYVDRNGTVVFEDRSSRYQNQVPVAVFGENPPGASPVEYPYISYSADFDPTYTFSQTNLTRPANSAFPIQVNAASQTKYGQRILTQTMQCNTDFDLTQASLFYLNRYANPKTRISTLTLNPAANPALWPVVLGLEISQRITVKRRTSNLTTSNDYYVEQVHHRVDAETGEWLVDLQVSPVFVTQAWVLGSATYGVLGNGTAPVY